MAGKRLAEAQAPAHPPILCATAGCPYDARVRVRRNRAERVTGKPNPVHVPYGAWLNLCHSCNDARIRSENLQYCITMGLDTPAKQKAQCQQQLKRGILKREPTREPGQDEEEVGA